MKSQPSVAVNTGNPIFSRISIILMVFVCLVGLACLPASAGTKYLTGSPDISASIAGSNEFAPGTTSPLTIYIQNSGVVSSKMALSGILDRDDMPSTAKMVQVSLGAEDLPVIIKSESQMIGDIAGSNTKPVTFQIRVKDDATAGKYTLPLHVKYTYLADAEQQGTDSVTYRYNEKDITINLPFVVKSAINLDVEQVTAEGVNAGGTGYITATLKNVGTDPGVKTIAKIKRNDGSPVIPVSSTVYLGSFAPGDEVKAKFKVSVTNDAQPQEYPLDFSATYENLNGETLETPAKRIGIPVGAKVGFSVVGNPAEISPGEKKVIRVNYRNDGDTTAYNAEARITMVDPFTSTDDLSYLGDIKPGDSSVALFEISAAGDAPEKTYGFDSEVRYRDALDTSQTSDTVKVPVMVTPLAGISTLIADPIPVVLLLLLLIGGGYYLFGVCRKISAS